MPKFSFGISEDIFLKEIAKFRNFPDERSHDLEFFYEFFEW
jgi:hypothetical protein